MKRTDSEMLNDALKALQRLVTVVDGVKAPYRLRQLKFSADIGRELLKEYQEKPAPNEIEFTRIKSDSNGNPRYVCHFLELVTAEEQQEFHHEHGISAISAMYAFAVKRANKIGGRKYHCKAYGGGIVFQSYSLDELTNSIRRLKGEE